MIKPTRSGIVRLYALSALLVFIGMLAADNLSHAESGDAETYISSGLMVISGFLTVAFGIWGGVMRGDEKLQELDILQRRNDRRYVSLFPPPPPPPDRPSQSTYTKMDIPTPDSGRRHYR